MGNMCCRRVVGYSPNGAEVEVGRCHSNQPNHQQGDHHQQKIISTPMSAYHSTGDDCAINELLEGRMDLDVILPDNRKVRLTVERRTPMMDLLVQAASATKISPAGHTIQVFSDNGKGSNTLHYKPSTPIGSLDANTICIVPKKDAQDFIGKRGSKTTNRPFEPTFRVQVHLPRNQLTVARVSPRITISELRSMVCKEKGLDTSRYQLVRPSDLGQPISGDTTLADYGSTEITLLSNTCIESHICNSTSHIMSYPKRSEEQKKKTGILRLLAEDTNHKVYKKMNSTGTAVNPSPAPTVKLSTEAPQRYKPKKRRPAPPPPPPVLPEPPFHSRQSSSDSSGYHEATSSYLREEHCVSVDEKASSDSSGVSSLDAKVQPQLNSVVNNSKKRKAPLPPPVGEQIEQKETDVDLKENYQLKDVIDVAEEESSKLVEKELLILDMKDSRTVNQIQKIIEAPTKEVLEDEETVTRVALVALNARIEQDVTGQEIASSIQAAFHSLDAQHKSEPSTAQLKSETSAAQQKYETSYLQKKAEYSLPLKKSEPHIQQRCESSLIQQKAEPSTLNLKLEPPLTLTNCKSTHKQQKSEHFLPLQKSELFIQHQQKSEPSLIQQKSGPCLVQQKSEPSLVQSKLEPSLLAIKRRDGPTTPINDQKSSISFESGLNNQHLVKKISGKSGDSKDIVSDKAVNFRISSLKLTPNDTSASSSEFHKSPVSVKVENGSIKSKNSLNTSSEVPPGDINSNSFQLQKSIVSLNRETKSISKPNSGLSIIGRVSKPLHTSNSVTSTLDKAVSQHHQLLSASRGSVGETHSNFYPLQKSLTKLSFESKDVSDDILEVFPPPPSEFRSVEKDVSSERSIPQTQSSSSKTLRRSSSLLNLANAPPPTKSNRIRHLQRSLSDLSIDDKGEFEAEQERLQREYIKLQRQFILWQQQLMNNHAMLSEECIVPQYARTLRQSHSLPEGEDYSDECTAPCPLVSRSLSYEPSKDRSTTLPRSSINIPSLEFGSTTTINNGSSTLRSSKTKSYFKPPQVRVSTKNRQRLPPEIRKDGDLDIYDDSKILSTILPSFDNLKLICENEDAEKNLLKMKSNNQPLTKLESLRNTRNQNDSSSTALHLKNNDQATKLEKLLNGDNSSTTVLHLKNGISKTQFGNQPNSNDHGNSFENLLKKTDETKKVPPPVPNKTSSLPKHIFGQNLTNGHCPKLANGDTGQSRQTCETNKVNGHCDPPPPPPMPMNGQVNVRVNNKVPSGHQRKIVEQQVDPREQLMQEIRRCGGRTALRKISLDMTS